MSRLNPVDLSEAIESVSEALSNVESFVDDIATDLENLIDYMRGFNDGDDVEALLDGFRECISDCEEIIKKCK